MPRETILIDADDTLWENNVFFEQTIEEFLALLEPFGYARDYARHILNETERRNIRQHGYGVRSFGRSLEDTYMKLAGHRAERATLEGIHFRVGELERTPPSILDGVIETLHYLAEKHRLILFTKGEAAEQAAKVERSGLQIHFEAIEIVPEKTADVYRALVNRHHVVKSRGWMVGNSPRSDINPALEAGLNAVFIAHPATWVMEHEELRTGAGRLLILQSFRNLRDHF
ncbi:MAG TPA: HAD family hydrolase [Candidatus Acidoferrales bacterium]|nr:HAD family hydrolase [Candidatus Acidoferrales bacterium]